MSCIRSVSVVQDWIRSGVMTPTRRCTTAFKMAGKNGLLKRQCKSTIKKKKKKKFIKGHWRTFLRNRNFGTINGCSCRLSSTNVWTFSVVTLYNLRLIIFYPIHHKHKLFDIQFLCKKFSKTEHIVVSNWQHFPLTNPVTVVLLYRSGVT